MNNPIRKRTKEELFNNPIHDYTKSLLSAVPIPDPIYEKSKNIIEYDSSELKCNEMVEFSDNHFVLV